MKTIHNVTLVDAPAETVWRVITDFDRYGEWNPFITALSGDLRVGGRLRATFALAGAQPRSFTPTVTVLDPGRRLTWRGHLAIRGLFDAEHIIAIEAREERTELTHTEHFHGLLVPLLRGTLTKTHEAFLAMDAALARRATASATT